MKAILIKSLILSFSIVGSIIGVGFISGKEILTFFAGYGEYSFILCFIACVLIGLFLYFIVALNIYSKNNTHINKKCKMFNKCLKYYKSNDNKCDKSAFLYIFDIILSVCQISICSAMFASFDTFFNLFNINFALNVIIKILVAVSIIIYLFKSKDNVFRFNSSVFMIMLFIILISLFCVLKSAKYGKIELKIDIKTAFYPLLFVGMNVFTVYPLVDELSQNFVSKKEGVLFAFLTSLFLFIPLTVVDFLIVFFGEPFLNSDMIMLGLVGSVSGGLFIIYLVAVLFGVITTLLSTAYGASSILKKFFPYSIIDCLVVLISLILSFFGFSNIIDKVYPFMGGVCLIFLIMKFRFQKKMSKF